MRTVILFISLFLSFSWISFGKDSTDWLLIYYVPYDNNLSHYADSIIDQFQSADLEKVSVLMLVDRSDLKGLTRYKFTNRGTKVDTLRTEKITHRKNIGGLFKFAAIEFEAKHTAVFMLNHGGRLNELGQDLQPDSTFLKMTDLNRVLFKYRQKTESTIDLLYLQVCAKSSMAPLFEVHKNVDYTLASQKLLGAPNYYYHAMVDFINKKPNCDGKQLAEIIALSDRKDMYESLTCVQNSGFSEVKTEFLKLISTIKNKGDLKLNKTPASFDYAGEEYWDFVDFLKQLELTTNDEKSQRDTVVTAIRNNLIAFMQYSDPSVTTSYSGISILALNKSQVLPYWRKMKLFEAFRINKLAKN